MHTLPILRSFQAMSSTSGRHISHRAAHRAVYSRYCTSTDKKESYHGVNDESTYFNE